MCHLGVPRADPWANLYSVRPSCDGPDLAAAVIADGRDGDGKRRHRQGPDDTAIVEILLDRGSDYASDADAVATHFQELRLPLGVEKCRSHRFRINRSQREYMPDFDSAHDFQMSFAVRRAIACDDVAQVGDEIGLAAVAPEVDSAQVEIGFIRAADEVAHQRDRPIDDERHVGRNADRTEIAWRASCRRDDLGIACPAKSFESRDLSCLGFVQGVIAA